MKKIKYVLYLGVCAILMGCNNAKEASTEGEQEYDNPAQERLMELIDKYYQENWSMYGKNKLVQEEFFEEFQAAMTNFFDTTAVINWSSYLSRLRTTDVVERGVKYKKISFRLDNRIETKAPMVHFDAVYLVHADSLETDKTYNVLKTIRENELVDFSGVVLKKKDNFVIFRPDINGIGYEYLDILILDVSKREKQE